MSFLPKRYTEKGTKKDEINNKAKKESLLVLMCALMGFILIGFSFFPTNQSGTLQTPLLYFACGSLIVFCSFCDLAKIRAAEKAQP